MFSECQANTSPNTHWNNDVSTNSWKNGLRQNDRGRPPLKGNNGQKPSRQNPKKHKPDTSKSLERYREERHKLQVDEKKRKEIAQRRREQIKQYDSQLRQRNSQSPRKHRSGSKDSH